MRAEPFRALMTKDCSCLKFVTRINDLNARHQRFFGTERVVAYRPAFDSPSAAQVLVTYNSSPGGIVDQAGSTISRVKALKRASLNYALRLVGTTWLISNVAIVDPGTT
jgi:hypothetical protein